MRRKNRRAKYEYRNRLGFNPGKYIKHADRRASAHGSSYKCGSDYRYSASYGQTPASDPYRVPYRGEVWFANLGCHPGTSVQDGCRPVLIISNDKGNHYASTVVVLPMTTRMKKAELPSHVEVYQEDLTSCDPNRPLEPSMVLAEQVTTIAKSSLRSYVGKLLPGDKLMEIDNAVRAQLSV